MWEVKTIQDFCPRYIESYHLAATRSVKLWSLTTNLLFKEPHQLTKFSDIVALLANKARFFRLRAVKVSEKINVGKFSRERP